MLVCLLSNHSSVIEQVQSKQHGGGSYIVFLDNDLQSPKAVSVNTAIVRANELRHSNSKVSMSGASVHVTKCSLSNTENHSGKLDVPFLFIFGQPLTQEENMLLNQAM